MGWGQPARTPAVTGVGWGAGLGHGSHDEVLMLLGKVSGGHHEDESDLKSTSEASLRTTLRWPAQPPQGQLLRGGLSPQPSPPRKG